MPSAPQVFSSQINFSKIPQLGMVMESAANASPPSSPVNGQLWYDTTNNRMMVRENGAWVTASNTGVVLTTDSAGGDISGTFSNLQIGANAVGTNEIANSAVTLAKIANIATDRLLGRDTASAGVVEELTVGGGIEFTGSGGIQRSALTGDVTATAGSNATTIGSNTVDFTKLADIATDRLIGRDTASTGDPEAITVGGGIEFTGSGGIQTSAFTGNVTKAAGGTALTIAAGVVTPAMLHTTTTLNGIASQNAATADITASNQKITNLGTPTNATDAATKGYVDGVVQGLDIHPSVRLATTASVGTYNNTGGTSSRGQLTAVTNTVDGVSVASGNRILVKDHSTPAANGIYTVTTVGTGANGVWDRAADFDSDAEVTAGAFTFVAEGNTLADTGWVLSTNDPITLGGASGTSLSFTQFNGAGSYIAGAGLTLTGNTFDVVGTANRITVNANDIDISSSYVGQTSITTLGTITTGTWTGTDIAVADGGTGASTAVAARSNLGATGKYAATLGALVAGTETQVTHSLNTTDVVVSFKTVSDGYATLISWRTVDANTIGLTSDIAYSASAIRCVVVG